MSNALNVVRNQIIKRIKDYKKTDEDHMNKIMKLESDLVIYKEKREKVQELLKEAYQELNEIDSFIEWKNKSIQNKII